MVAAVRRSPRVRNEKGLWSRSTGGSSTGGISYLALAIHSEAPPDPVWLSERCARSSRRAHAQTRQRPWAHGRDTQGGPSGREPVAHTYTSPW